MPTVFEVEAIEKHGWRQGAVLGNVLSEVARKFAPQGLEVCKDDWLIVTSHDCDIVNDRLEKEPSVEILRAKVIHRKSPDKQQLWGRNPRVLQLEVADGDVAILVTARVHDRWALPREVLSEEPPARCLDDKSRRLIAEWLAKRYIRAAFPTSFDARWRAKHREWTSLLEKYSRCIQGVYLRLSTLAELGNQTPYKIHLIVAAPGAAKADRAWPTIRDELHREIAAFWLQFMPAIEFIDVDIVGTDELTLAEIEPYQRFDADWVSFTDDTPTVPATADLRG